MKSIDETPLSLDEIYLKIGFGKFHIIAIIIIGFIQCFDAAELILLAFIGPILSCRWKISPFESSLITMSVFVGMIFGSLGFGKLSDIYGRKVTLIFSVCGIVYFSLLCATSPTVIWIIGIRFVIGIFIGGVTIMISTFLTEIMPLSHRGLAQMCVQIFWSFGSYYISFLTILLVPKYDWRLWMIISACPMILIIPFTLWLPESPRYLLLIRKKSDAIKIINEIAKMNNSETISNVKNIEFNTSSICDIFHRNYIKTTIISVYICFVAGISYYSFVISATIINDIPHKCLQDMNTIFDSSIYMNITIDNSCCSDQSWESMKTVFISITGELLGYIFGAIFISSIKRKLYLQILMLVNIVTYFLMNLCISPTNMGILMMFGRGSAISMLGISYLYISEVFPTTIRSFSIGLGSSFARIGAIFSSFVIYFIMSNYSFIGSTIFYCALNMIAIILVLLLPYETKDRMLMQSVEEIDEIKNYK